MPIYSYKCDKCEESFDQRFYFLDEILYNSDTDSKVKESALDYYKCPKCNNKKAPRMLFEHGQDFAGWMKGITDRTLRRQQKFAQDGMDKAATETFLKEAIDASKERQMEKYPYAAVVPDMKQMVKTGQAKIVSSDRKAERVEAIRKINADLDKKTANKLPRKK